MFKKFLFLSAILVVVCQCFEENEPGSQNTKNNENGHMPLGLLLLLQGADYGQHGASDVKYPEGRDVLLLDGSTDVELEQKNKQIKDHLGSLNRNKRNCGAGANTGAAIDDKTTTIESKSEFPGGSSHGILQIGIGKLAGATTIVIGDNVYEYKFGPYVKSPPGPC